MDEFWLNSAEFFEADKEPSLIYLYRNIFEIIKNNKAKSIFDHGTGKGLLFKEFDNIENYDISVFDINLKMAKSVLKEYNDTVNISLYNPMRKNKKFDVVVSNLVDVCIESNVILKNYFRECYDSTRANGIFIFGTTHPCFRDESFLGFETHFTNGKEFNYFKEPESFKLYYGMQDRLTFMDNHRTLSFLMNLMIEIGFTPIFVNEIKDYKDTKFTEIYNNKPAFILIAFKKIER